MSQHSLSPPTYDEAIEHGEILSRESWHKPKRFQDTRRGFGGFGRRRRTQPDHPNGCGCDLVTEKGAYRDETVETPDGRVVHFYHQSPIVVEDGDRYRVSSCGYKTSTTKERLNRYLPRGYRVVQEDMEWYLDSYDPEVPFDQRETDRQPFEDGMVIEA